MPIDIRSRIAAASGPVAPDQPLANLVAFYANQNQGFSSDIIIQSARDQEALGFDSSLFPQNATGPAVWPVVGWALAATTRLRLVAAHRIGLQLPTTAARVLATLDRLSNGRVAIHLLQGRSDSDLQRDGLFLDKASRYQQADEYLDIFFRELSADQPFDHQGDFYSVNGAHSDVRPVQKPWPPISIPGSSEQAVALAARYADVHNVPIASLDQARQAIAHSRHAARQQGRSLAFWGDANIILGEDDHQARAQADAVARILEQQTPSAPQDFGNARAARHSHPVTAADNPLWHEPLQRLSGHGYTLVGSPATLADYFLTLYALGVSVITLGGFANQYGADGQALASHGERALLKELIERLHQGALQHDQHPHALFKAAPAAVVSE